MKTALFLICTIILAVGFFDLRSEKLWADCAISFAKTVDNSDSPDGKKAQHTCKKMDKNSDVARKIVMPS